MLCKNCGRRVNVNEKHCICGSNPFGEDKNDFQIIKQILSGVSQPEVLKNNSNSITDVTEPPQRPKVKDCSKHGKNDGMIFDIDERLEYIYNGGKAFEPVTRKSMMCPAGNYIFRDKTDHNIIYHITVNEPKKNYFFIAVIIPVCLVLVIAAAAIVGLPKLSGLLKTHDFGESVSTTKTASTAKNEETVVMRVFGVNESDKSNAYLSLYEDANFTNKKNIKDIKNKTRINCYTNESNDTSTAICWNNKKYYVHSEYLFNKDEKEKEYYAINNVKVYSSIYKPDKNTTVEFGDEIKLIRENNSYCQINKGKDFYYITKKEFYENFSDNEPEKKYINEKVKVFSKPSNDDSEYTDFNKSGEKVKVIKFNNDFYYIRYNKKTWYIESDKLNDKQKTAAATTTTYQPTQGTSQDNTPQIQRQMTYNPPKQTNGGESGKIKDEDVIETGR